jgi:mannitol/fructose-specific phosphotransferase system IIA component (Ntr-type)
MLERFINQDLIIINPKARNKKELFKEMTRHLAKKGYIESQRYFYRSLLQREQAGNTEILPNIAIPHAGCEYVENLFLMIVICKEGIDYGNPRLGAVKIIFLFGCANQHNKIYLRLLAKSARLLKNPVLSEKLLNSVHPDQIIEIIKEFDQDTEDNNMQPEHFLMLITLFKKHKLPDLLSAMLEVGIHNAAVVSSTSLARRIAYLIPVFAGLSIHSHKKSIESSLVISTITDKQIPRHLAAILKEQQIDLTEPGTGYIQLFPTKIVIGNIDEFS